MAQVSVEKIWQALDEIKDPEIPVVSLVEMGIVREVQVAGEAVCVIFTPTFSGCPALEVMRAQIHARLAALGIAHVDVKTVLHPPWTSDWITDAARAKLKAFGLAPPARHGGDVNVIFHDAAQCPRCDSQDVIRQNAFGSTLCRMIYTCNACHEPFEQFKAL